MRLAHLAAIASCAFALTASAQPGPMPFVGGDIDQDTILERMRESYPREMRQVGTSSVTLRLELAPGLRAAFKPRTGSHPRGFLAEIAAYRLARLLGMDNVPPVVELRLPRTLMERNFTSEHEEDWEALREEIRWDAPGVARGSAIYWIPRMRASELATEAGVDAVASWLTLDGELPEESSGLARDLSTMFAYDYLIGNWDRLSGGNVSITDAGDRLFVRDHNVAFSAPIVGARYRRIRLNLERIQRFSRGFVERVVALDRESIRESLRGDSESEERPILRPAQIDGVLRRRRGLLSYVAALVALHGQERVLIWP